MARATLAPVIGSPASWSQKMVWRYSSSATVAWSWDMGASYLPRDAHRWDDAGARDRRLTGHRPRPGGGARGPRGGAGPGLPVGGGARGAGGAARPARRGAALRRGGPGGRARRGGALRGRRRRPRPRRRQRRHRALRPVRGAGRGGDRDDDPRELARDRGDGA